MSDLKSYVQQRKRRDPEFAEGFESGYADFKIGVLLRKAREEAGLTQEQMAERLSTRRSAVSRVENNADEVRLSMLKKYARALGKEIQIHVA